jgi:alkylation response protein AidB-like acyl-CoA dehydrogenase
MSEYHPPVDDMIFVLKELVGLDDLPQIKSGELDLELIETVLEEAGKFSSGVLAPINQSGDCQKSVLTEGGSVKTPDGFKEAYQQFVENGWNGVPFNSDHGGQDLPWLVAYPIQEMIHSSNMSFALCPLLTQAAVDAIETHGSEEQKNLYLTKLTTGEWTGSMQLTEPQAGSDLGAIKTKAEKQEDGTYKITGQKIYITYGEHDFTDNIIHMVLARTPDAPEGVKGISMFIVPKFFLDENGNTISDARNDVKATALEHKLGIHASPTCVMQYGDNGGATAYLLGEENKGIKYMFTMMNAARLGVGLQGVAIADRAYRHALSYAKERVQGTKIGDQGSERVAIIEHPDVKRMLLSMKAQIEAGRALAYQAALLIDLTKLGDEAASGRLDLMTPIVKGWCTDMAVNVCSTGLQVFGGMGFIEETGAAQFYRDARILPIYEGTNGIQANDLLFRKTVMSGGDLAYEWIEFAKESVNEFENLDQIKEMSHSFDLTLDQLRRAVDFLVELASEHPDQAAARAKPYLQAFGTIMAGFMMLKSARCALESEGYAGTKFSQNKLLTASFYLSDILPSAGSDLEVVMSPGDIVASFDPEMF